MKQQNDALFFKINLFDTYTTYHHHPMLNSHLLQK